MADTMVKDGFSTNGLNLGVTNDRYVIFSNVLFLCLPYVGWFLNFHYLFLLIKAILPSLVYF